VMWGMVNSVSTNAQLSYHNHDYSIKSTTTHITWPSPSTSPIVGVWGRVPERLASHKISPVCDTAATVPPISATERLGCCGVLGVVCVEGWRASFSIRCVCVCECACLCDSMIKVYAQCILQCYFCRIPPLNSDRCYSKFTLNSTKDSPMHSQCTHRREEKTGISPMISRSALPMRSATAT
jgi:hypothetical protein